MNSELSVAIRLIEEGDSNFIYDSWIRSAKAMNIPNGKRGDIKRFCTRMREHISTVLGAGTVYVACNPDVPSQVYGWCVVVRSEVGCILHYVYVKKLYRSLRVCSRLVKAARWEPKQNALTYCTSASFEACYAGRFVDIGIR